MIRALLPDPAAREALRRECEVDLSVWLAAMGAVWLMLAMEGM